jgi:hypothetical protein
MKASLDKFQSYSNYVHGYDATIKFLYEGIEINKIAAPDAVYPLLFLIRHFIEIGCKGNIHALAITSGLTDGTGRIHQLRPLYDAVKIHFNNVVAKTQMTVAQEEEFKKAHDNLNELVKLFENIDPNSVAFRYPKTIQKKTRSLDVDLNEIYNQYVQAKDFLIYLADFMLGNRKTFYEDTGYFLAGGIWDDKGTLQDDKKFNGGI